MSSIRGAEWGMLEWGFVPADRVPFPGGPLGQTGRMGENRKNFGEIGCGESRLAPVLTEIFA